MSYWTNRQEELKKTAERDEAKLKKRLSAYYDAEYRRLEKEIAAYYQKYGEDNVIAYRNLLQSLPDADKRLLIEQMEDFAKKYPPYAELMPVRESIYKLNRLEGLQYSVFMAQANVAGYTNEQMAAYLTKLSQRGVNDGMETLGFGKNFYSISSDVVKQFVDVPWCNGENFSTRIWNDTKRLAQYLSQDIAQGFARGDSYDHLTKQLRQRFSHVNKRGAYRLVYTEGTYVMAESSIQPFLEDFEEYRPSPVLDRCTCSICREMAKHKFKMSERKAGVNFPPFHPWCRCSWEFAVDDWNAWMEGYEKRHFENKKQAETIKNRLRSGLKKNIMKLPKYEEAVIPRAKFTEYVLNPEKDLNKARAFELALGYTMDNADELIQQIYNKLPEYEAKEKPDNGWGKRYEVKMELTGPNGKTAKVLTAWIVDKETGKTRLTSAYVDRE